MIRHAAAVILVLCLWPAQLSAQSAELTVNASSAEVHKGPSASSPVIGKAPRGAVLEVTRELGDWVKVTWPDAQDGSGYVYLRAGSIARNGTPDPNRLAGSPTARPATESAPATTTGVPAETTAAGNMLTTTQTVTHFVGLGGRIGTSSLGFGATARVWTRDRLGVQVEVSRDSITSPTATGRLTSVQFAPSVTYSLRDHVTDYVWVRPYLGGGASFYRSTLSVTPGAVDSVSDSRLGYHVFGGGEFTFASVPRFAVSADLGYRWPQTPFEGFELGGLGVSVSGHWYVK